FDYLVCRGTAAAITGARRITPNGATPTVAVDFVELEPYPGEDATLVNGGMEDWDAGSTVAPTGWNINGAGATVAKNTTAGQFDSVLGSASASLTRNGADCSI